MSDTVRLLVQGCDGLDVHGVVHVDEGIGGTWRQPCPLLDELVIESVQFFQICGSDVVNSEKEPDGWKKVLVVDF